MNDRISEHISFEEATYSKTAAKKKIKNIPDEATIYKMKIVAEECFEPARKQFGPIRVNSFYRCKELNKAVGGSENSQHIIGEAIDMDRGSVEKNKELFEWCKANLIYDQLINEKYYSWIHISFCHKYNRNMAFAVE